MADKANEIVLYQPDAAMSLEVMVGDDTVWLTQEQMTTLFDRDKSTISRHIRNIFKEGELTREVVVAKFATTTLHGALPGKTQTHLVEHYNLDVIISVGYRVKSQRGTQFRIWATTVLREYLLKGYAVHNRLERIEHRLDNVEDKVDFFVRTTLPPVEGIFYQGQIFDAYEFVCKLIKAADKRIVLIDNYVDETVLGLLAKRKSTTTATIYTSKISKAFLSDVAKHNEQYPPIIVKQTTVVHDRFLIIDEDVYHLGASVKDLGKKLFAFARLGIPAQELLERL